MDGVRRTDIAQRVRAARLRTGLSREALARRCGLSWPAIAQIESGRRTNLRPATLAALARALGLTIDYLVEGSSSSPRMLHHQALLYAADDELLAEALPFLATAHDSEAVLAVVRRKTGERLRQELGPRAGRVRFVDRRAFYRTPEDALAGYREFLERAIGAGATWVRILGEPVWGGRDRADGRGWKRYETLVDVVFATSPVSVLCPYDARELDADVIDLARATHPHVVEDGATRPSDAYRGPGGCATGPGTIP